MFVTAIYSQKGGVGKTTTALNLCAALREAGESALLIDLDPRGDLSALMGVVAPACGSAEILAHPNCVNDSISICANGTSLISASPRLLKTEASLAQTHDSAYRLRRALACLETKYDHAIIDCAPSLSVGTLNAIATANLVISPVLFDVLSFRAFIDSQTVVSTVREATGCEVVFRGLPTLFERRFTLQTELLAEMKTIAPELLFDAIIPRSVRFTEACALGLSLFDLAPRTQGAIAFKALAREILQEKTYVRQTPGDTSSDVAPDRLYRAA